MTHPKRRWLIVLYAEWIYCEILCCKWNTTYVHTYHKTQFPSSSLTYVLTRKRRNPNRKRNTPKMNYRASIRVWFLAVSLNCAVLFNADTDDRYYSIRVPSTQLGLHLPDDKQGTKCRLVDGGIQSWILATPISTIVNKNANNLRLKLCFSILCFLFFFVVRTL